jgi:hypothetical protein
VETGKIGQFPVERVEKKVDEIGELTPPLAECLVEVAVEMVELTADIAESAEPMVERGWGI